MRRILLAIGAGLIGIIIAPVIGPILGRLFRPVVKGGVKTGISAYQSARVKLAVLQETLEDIVAESHDEIRQQRDVTEP